MLRGLSLTCSPVLTDCCASCINNDESDEGQAGSAWQTDVSLTPELECPIKFQVKRQLGRFSFFLMMTSVTRRLDACRWWRLAFLCWYPHLNARLLFLYILLFMTFIVYDTSLSCPPHLSPPPPTGKSLGLFYSHHKSSLTRVSTPLAVTHKLENLNMLYSEWISTVCLNVEQFRILSYYWQLVNVT